MALLTPQETLFRSLPRPPRPRAWHVDRPRVGVLPALRAGKTATARRYALWAREGSRMALRWRADRARGEATDRQLGIRLRDLFEAVGGTGIKIGQQLAMRIDLLPYETCRQLATLTDAVSPFSSKEAVAAVERFLGCPLAERFQSFDPLPIGSASLACVYQAVLLDGRRVAVKVKRPGVEELFASDLEAIDLFTHGLELLGAVRERFFVHMRNGLKDMFLEELDFAQEARLQRIFRRTLRHAPSWLSVPRVVTELSGRDVLVSEFAPGVSMVEILEAVEVGGARAEAFLHDHGVRPERLAKRVLTLSLWSQNEATLYHADPHPGNLIIQPGDRVVLVDFGACGWTNERTMLYGRRVIERIYAKDPDGVAQVNLKQAEPMPRLDYPEYQERANTTFRKWLLGGEDPNAEWWERSTATVWVEFSKLAQTFGVPLNMDVLRLVRCTLLYDTISTRLDPKIDVSLVHDYFVDAHRRRAKRGVSPLRVPLVDRAWELGQGEGQRLERSLRALDRFELALPPPEIAHLSREAIVGTLVDATRNALVAGLLLLALALVGPAGVGTATVAFAVLVAVLLATRRVQARLSYSTPRSSGGGGRRFTQRGGWNRR